MAHKSKAVVWVVEIQTRTDWKSTLAHFSQREPAIRCKDEYRGCNPEEKYRVSKYVREDKH